MPFLITDPVDANADLCVFKNGTAPEQVFPVVTENGQRICKIDLATVPTGVNNITLKLRNSVWGTESPSVPFVFTRPALISMPAGTRLVP